MGYKKWNNMTNEELISTYKNFCNKIVTISYEFTQHRREVKDAEDTMNGLFTSLKKYFEDVDFHRFNFDELKQLGFSPWDDNLILTSPTMLSLMKRGTTLRTISGDIKIVGVDEIDTDTRFGMLAYGLMISNLRDFKLNTII